jgi:heat shock protein HtpX
MDESVTKPVLVYTRINENRRKTILLLVVFALFFLPLLLFFSNYAWAVLLMTAVYQPLPMKWMTSPSFHLYGTLVVGGIFAILVALLEFSYAETIALKLTRARSLAPEEGARFRKSVENLCIGSGLPQPALYVMDSGAPNAFTVGLCPERAKLVVTSGLLKMLDRRELEGVIAHELSHIGNYDIRLNTVAAVMESLFSLPSRIFLAPFYILFRVNRVLGWVAAVWLGFKALRMLVFIVSMVVGGDLDDPFVLPGLAGSALVFYAFFLAPLVGRIIRLAISRQREFLADADAYLLTRHPEALARALKKISQWPGDKLKVNRAMSRLFIVSPWHERLSGHPAVDERIAALARMGGGFSPAELEVSCPADYDTTADSVSQEPAPAVVRGAYGCSVMEAIIWGSLAGTIVLVVLVVAKILLMVFLAGAGEQVDTFSVRFQFIPAVVAFGFAAHKGGIAGGKCLAWAFGLGFLVMLAYNRFLSDIFYFANLEEAPLAYQMEGFLHSLLTIVLAALAGAFLAHIQRS